MFIILQKWIQRFLMFTKNIFFHLSNTIKVLSFFCCIYLKCFKGIKIIERKADLCLTADILTSIAHNFNRWQMILFGTSVQWFIIDISAKRGGEDLEKIKLKVAVISENPRKVLRTFQPMLVNGGIWDICLWVSFISEYQICWMCISWLLVGKDDAEKTSDVTECGCVAYAWHCLSTEKLLTWFMNHIRQNTALPVVPLLSWTTFIFD